MQTIVRLPKATLASYLNLTLMLHPFRSSLERLNLHLVIPFLRLSSSVTIFSTLYTRSIGLLLTSRYPIVSVLWAGLALKYCVALIHVRDRFR